MKSLCPNLKFTDKKVLVLGFSKSGISAAKYLNKAFIFLINEEEIKYNNIII